MVARKFCVHHNGADFDVDYDTDDGLEVFRFQLFSLTSVPPDEQKILGVDNDRLVSEDSDLAAISDRLRLVSIDEEEKVEKLGEEKSMEQASSSDAGLLSDEELARMLQAEEEALMMQQYVVGQNKGEMEGRLRPYIDQVQLYEDPKRQEAARKTVPVEELEEKALVSLAREGNFAPTKIEQNHAFLLQLLFWFKRSFSWVNAPACEGCGGETVNRGMGNPLPAELQYGASRVEVYSCRYCMRSTRFPRYNDPLKLLQTRRGRCGEWANCFTLYCRAFGYESRLVLDFTDHVWTECFTQHLGRWMHLDPCEAVYDRPLLYEKGWNKKLNYAFGISRDGVYDVTKRYTRKWHEVLSRRIMITELDLSNVIFKLTKECRRGFTPQEISALEERDRKEREEIEKSLHSTEDSSISLPGRQSGDKEWRLLRGEITDSGSNSLSSSSCPVRNCVDEHVTRIYNAFSPLITHMVENSVPQPRAIEVLSTFRELLVKIGNMPFKSRRASLDSISKEAPSFVEQLLPSFTELLDALGLKFENLEGKIEICLAGDPVKTSLALPVVLVALDDTILNLKQMRNLNKDILSLPLLKVNRIHSGSVLASGEELPFGVSKSAFDGTHEVKWEEPNGAKGCWLIYKVSGNQMKELVGYELMSANDVPERDPKDWVLEGSNDGGSSWTVLDKQNSQMFEARFQRKTYIVKPTGAGYNAFRFRFLAVRDVSNPRFQVGSIDLYSRSNN